ncbi:MAG: FG-GAP repeat protein [Acidobacteria bacterium]|nr:FG-GAP repeat protein [Acidobacteriota bacterium]
MPTLSKKLSLAAVLVSTCALGFAGIASGTPDWTVYGPQTNSQFGADVQSAGDVNRDGYDDVLITATAAYSGDISELAEGRVYLYLGGPSGPATTPSWSFESNQYRAQLSRAIGAGDVNGDGYADILVAAPWYDNGQADAGKVWLFYGSPTGPGATPDWTTEGNVAGANYGYTLAAGRLNNDNYSDILVAAPWFSGGQTNEGKVVAFFGSPNGPSTTPDWSVESNLVGALFGAAVSVGDVDGDGIPDVGIGAPGYDGKTTDQGAVFVYAGGNIKPSTGPSTTLLVNTANAGFGYKLSLAGDYNRDGIKDVAASSAASRTSEIVSIFPGKVGGPAGKASLTLKGELDRHDVTGFGSAIAAGDVNRDGYSDLAIGAYSYGDYDSHGTANIGQVYVFLGGPSGLHGTWSALVEGVLDGDFLGSAISATGDFNGDGYKDVLASADGLDLAPHIGRVTLYFGGRL